MAILISFGEALIDWIPLGKRDEGALQIPLYGQFPGGAPANVAVALARLGGEAFFLGRIGTDPAGAFLRQSLDRYGVNTQYLLDDPAPTPMAFVSLDEKGEREFTFHRTNTADIQYRSADFPVELFTRDAIFHICSNTLTDPQLKETTLAGLRLAQTNGCLTSFDVNLRLPLWNDPELSRPAVFEAIALTNLLKLSLEELEYLAGANEPDECMSELLRAGPHVILLTDGGNPVRVFRKGSVLEVSAPTVDLVDTTGAGDAFVGGLLFSLLQDGVTSQASLEDYTALNLEAAVSRAVQCGAFAVTRRGAWTALPRQSDIS